MKDFELEKLDFTGWPLPDSYLVEIGRVSALWGSMESLLNICIGKLAGFNDLNDPKPFILIYHSSFPQKLDMLGTLCEHLAPDFPNLADSISVIGTLRAAQKLRNTYMHQGMTEDPQTGQVRIATGSARGKLKFSVQNVTVQELRRASVTINEAQRALYKLVLNRDVPAPWETIRK